MARDERQKKKEQKKTTSEKKRNSRIQKMNMRKKKKKKRGRQKKEEEKARGICKISKNVKVIQSRASNGILNTKGHQHNFKNLRASIEFQKSQGQYIEFQKHDSRS